MSLIGDWVRFFFRDWLDFWFIVIAGLTIIVMMSGWLGCIAPDAVDVLTKTDLDAVAEALIVMDADVKNIGADLSETISNASETTQKAISAISITDQSTSDKWLNRGLMLGLVALAVLIVVFASYPVGKRRWLRNGKGGPPQIPIP